jgi:ketosteroid isomerase-like protein
MSSEPEDQGRDRDQDRDREAAANRALVERAYAAFARGDVAAVMAAFDDDILWHVPGRGPLSGDYRGQADVLRFFQHFLQLSGGSFRIDIDAVMARDDRVVVLVTESAERQGRRWSSPQVHVWTVKNGLCTVFWQFQGDQQTEDEFWAAAQRASAAASAAALATAPAG